MIEGQREQGHAEFHHRVLEGNGYLSGPALSSQGDIAENGNVLVPVQIGVAFGAVGGRKDHRLFLIRQSANNHIEKGTNQGTKNKAVKKKECFHICYIRVRCALLENNVSLNQKAVPVIIAGLVGMTYHDPFLFNVYL